MVPPPVEYIDMILIPAILHIDPLTFAAYPPGVQGRVRQLLMDFIGGGWGPGPLGVHRG